MNGGKQHIERARVYEVEARKLLESAAFLENDKGHRVLGVVSDMRWIAGALAEDAKMLRNLAGEGSVADAG